MNALARLFSTGSPDTPRNSAAIRQEIEGYPQPQQYSEMLHLLGRRRQQVSVLTGPERKAGDAEVAKLDAEAVAFRKKHAADFDRSDELYRELEVVQRQEHQQFIADRTTHHETVEAANYRRLAETAEAAKTELLAQGLATHYLSKRWGVEVAYRFGFPTLAVERRAQEILAELLAA